MNINSIVNRMGHFVHLLLRQSSPFISRTQEKDGAVSLLYDVGGNRKYLTIAERKAFLRAAEALPAKKRTFCLMLAYTGARLSEVLALSHRSIDFETRAVIFETLKKRRKGVYRAVPIPSNLLKELNGSHELRLRQQSSTAATEPLWSFGRTTAWKLVKTVMAMANIRDSQASPKALRHAFAVAALQAGVPINLVKKWLGHSRISTTAIYADAVGDEEYVLAARLWKTF